MKWIYWIEWQFWVKQKKTLIEEYLIDKAYSEYLLEYKLKPYFSDYLIIRGIKI